MSDSTSKDPRFLAAIDLVRRTGVHSFQLRYSDDEKPMLWMAVAEYRVKDGRPTAGEGATAYKVAAGLDPLQAVFQLCDQAVDGGRCVHCHRVTGFAPRSGSMPLAEHVCWYQWDPELRTYRRSCE